MKIAVTCACSREMAARAIPKGSYRCGCGSSVRVTVQVPARETCTVEGCDRVVERSEVVALCGAHVKAITLALVADVYNNYPPNTWMPTVRKYKDAFGHMPEMPEWLARMEYSTPVDPDAGKYKKHEPVVYFAIVGDQVKIGTTSNLIERFMAINLPPGAVIHTIPGSASLEKHYHHTFAEERTTRTEWFKLSPRLRSHIDELVQSGKATCPDSVMQLSTRSFRSIG